MDTSAYKALSQQKRTNRSLSAIPKHLDSSAESFSRNNKTTSFLVHFMGPVKLAMWRFVLDLSAPP